MQIDWRKDKQLHAIIQDLFYVFYNNSTSSHILLLINSQLTYSTFNKWLSTVRSDSPK